MKDKAYEPPTNPLFSSKEEETMKAYFARKEWEKERDERRRKTKQSQDSSQPQSTNSQTEG